MNVVHYRIRERGFRVHNRNHKTLVTEIKHLLRVVSLKSDVSIVHPSNVIQYTIGFFAKMFIMFWVRKTLHLFSGFQKEVVLGKLNIIIA